MHFGEEVRRSIEQSGGKDSERIQSWCSTQMYYSGIDAGTKGDYNRLRDRIIALEKKHKLNGNRIFYLAIPPQFFEPTVRSISDAGMNDSKGWTRLVIEKPFGRDLKSALELNTVITKYFSEEQIYRMDHYLGKETVQNLLTFRFGNSIFESLWNREKIEKVEITVAEQLGVEERADYYDQSGALRDMIQNHLTQLMALTAMEIPEAFDAIDLRYEKVKVLRAIRAIDNEDVVMGQYAEGEIGGHGVYSYRKEDGVKRGSKTPTFAALKLHINNWRWSGVPFYLRTGKRLKETKSEIVITFRCPPISLFKSSEGVGTRANVLVIAIQPNEGFKVLFQVKRPGLAMAVNSEWMHFSYSEAFGPIPEAYHTLLLDVMRGDQTLFVSADETLESWKLYTPVLHHHHDLHFYPAGSWGPEQAEKLV